MSISQFKFFKISFLFRDLYLKFLLKFLVKRISVINKDFSIFLKGSSIKKGLIPLVNDVDLLVVFDEISFYMIENVTKNIKESFAWRYFFRFISSDIDIVSFSLFDYYCTILKVQTSCDPLILNLYGKNRVFHSINLSEFQKFHILLNLYWCIIIWSKISSKWYNFFKRKSILKKKKNVVIEICKILEISVTDWNFDNAIDCSCKKFVAVDQFIKDFLEDIKKGVRNPVVLDKLVLNFSCSNEYALYLLSDISLHTYTHKLIPIIENQDIREVFHFKNILLCRFLLLVFYIYPTQKTYSDINLFLND